MGAVKEALKGGTQLELFPQRTILLDNIVRTDTKVAVQKDVVRQEAYLKQMREFAKINP